MSRFIISLIFVITGAILQGTNSIIIGGIKPNLALIFIITLGALQKDFLQKTVLVFSGALMLKFYPGIELQNILFIITAMGGLLLISILPWKNTINIIIVIFLATLIMNITTGNLEITLAESTLNTIIAILTIFSIEAIRIYIRKRKPSLQTKRK